MANAPLPYAADAPAASQELLDTVVSIARGAGDVTMEYFRTDRLGTEIKGDGSPVTLADKAAERYVRERIAEVDPGAAIIGEEEGSSAGTSGLEWIIDPIDGTKGFTRGVPLYANLIAVNDEHGPLVGVVNIPATGEIVWAGRHLGAFDDHGPVTVSKTASTDGAFVTTSSVTRWGAEVFSNIVEAGMNIYGWGDGYGWLMAATGRIDAMIDLNGGSVWDYAPMPVIFAEAGGRYSLPDGSWGLDNKSAVGSNGLIHEAILTAINA